MTTTAPERRVTVTPAEEEAWVEINTKLARVTPRPRTEAFDPTRYCGDYRAVRPALVRGVPLLEKIPFSWARGVAKAIRLLMVLADTACPVR